MSENKRIVKVKFLDYWSTFQDEVEDSLIMRILRRHYNVQICDDADYVFFSTMGESHWGVKDSAIKIYQTGENLVPDFNACDYAIGFEWMDYEDRYIRFPLYLFYPDAMLRKMESKHEIPDSWDLHREKPDFCSFVVSNHRNPKRKVVFDKMCQYRKVDSGGRYLNNVGGAVKDKLAFEYTHKFSICFENGAHNGYTTEKLVQAFAARTVPIYWGDPKVGKVFNTDAFIDAGSYPSFDAVIERVKELDQNDELYMQMLRQPAMLSSATTIDEEMAAFEKWLLAIFEQPIEKAYRRNREMHGLWYIERRLKLDSKANRSAIWKARKERLSRGLSYIKDKYFKKV